MPHPSSLRPLRALVVASAVSMALVATLATPAQAAETGAANGAATVGDFALGDGLEGLIDASTGALAVGFPVAGGAALEWDSRDAGVDRFGLGGGWRWRGIGFISVDGGVRVFPASGGQYEMDASHPSGLAGYDGGDVAFSRVEGDELLPARIDGRAAAQPYRFVLAELGGRRTYYRDDGAPVAIVDVHGNRTDLAWDADRRLTRMVDELGVMTELTWQADAISVEASARDDRSDAVSASVEIGPSGPSAVVDAVGRRTWLSYDPATELLSAIENSSDALTRVSWQGLPDGTIAVDRVGVSDARSGVELSNRSWRATVGAASGWPAVSSAAAPVAAGGDYETAVSDGASTTRSVHSADHRLTSRAIEVTAPSGAVVVQRQRFAYPEPGAGSSSRPVSAEFTVTDAAGAARGVVNRFEYDELGRPLEEVGSDGAVTEWSYDEVTRPVEPLPGGIKPPPIGLAVGERRTAPDGLITETRHELDESGRAVVATESFAGRTGASLTRTGRVEYAVEPDGFVSEERRYAQGGAGDAVVTASSRQIDLAAGRARLTETVEATPGAPAVMVTTLADLLHGAPVETTDVLGNRATVEYDAVGRETRRTDAAGRSVETRHEDRAEVVTHPDGVVVTERVDALGRVIEVSDNIADGRPVEGFVRVAETRAYPDPATVIVTDAWGASTRSERDVFGRVERVVSPTGVTEVHEYDDVSNTETTGLTTTGSLADAEATSTMVFSDAGQATEQRVDRADGAASTTTSASFDGLGRQTGSTDEVSSSTVEYDAFGNAVATETTPVVPGEVPGAASAHRVERRFDPFGQSVQKTVAAGADRRSGGERELDTRGRMVARTDQHGERTTREYTPDGRLARETTGYGRVTTNEYHPQTRALVSTRTESPIGSTVEVAYEHDPATGAVIAAFDPRDRATTEIAYEWDAWGNPLSTTYPTGKAVSHRYDEHGRRIATTDVVGSTTTFAYTEAGLLASAVKTASGCEGDCDPVASVAYRYDELGRVVTLERGNGATTHIEFTALNQIGAEQTTDAAGELVVERHYEHDSRGNTVRRTETARTVGAAGDLVDESIEYTYDHLDRLVGSIVRAGHAIDSPITRQTDYVPTSGGDLASERVVTDPGTDAERETLREFGYDATGELRTITTDGETVEQTYDAAGNLVLDADGTAYTYNAGNQLVEERVADDRTEVAYWADGLRRSLTAPGAGGQAAATEFYWDGSALVNELHTANTSSGEWDAAGYLLGAGRHARTIDRVTPDAGASADRAYYVTDPLGSATHLLGDDGSAVEAYAYTDYGAARASAAGVETAQEVGEVTRNPVRFAGELTDASGRQYLRARMYEPATMRFISEDEAHQFSRYAYGNLNPIRLADPSGRTATDVISWVVLGVGLVSAMLGVGAVAATLATGGLITLGPVSIGAAVIGGVADGYSLFVATGQVLSNLRPEWVDDDLEAFFQSEEAVWSEALVGVAAIGSAMLFKTGYQALKLQAEVDQLKTTISERLRKHLDVLGNHNVSSEALRQRMDAALSAGGSKVLRRWGQIRAWTTPPAPYLQTLPAGQQYTTILVTARQRGVGERLKRVHEARWLASALTVGGQDVDDLMAPIGSWTRRELSQAYPDLYGGNRYTPYGVFKAEESGDLIFVDHEFFGSGDSWHARMVLPPEPITAVDDFRPAGTFVRDVEEY